MAVGGAVLNSLACESALQRSWQALTFVSNDPPIPVPGMSVSYGPLKLQASVAVHSRTQSAVAAASVVVVVVVASQHPLPLPPSRLYPVGHSHPMLHVSGQS